MKNMNIQALSFLACSLMGSTAHADMTTIQIPCTWVEKEGVVEYSSPRGCIMEGQRFPESDPIDSRLNAANPKACGYIDITINKILVTASKMDNGRDIYTVVRQCEKHVI